MNGVECGASRKSWSSRLKPEANPAVSKSGGYWELTSLMKKMQCLLESNGTAAAIEP